MTRNMELRNNKQVRNFNYFYIVKSLLIIFSLILLLIILVQLIDLYKYKELTFKERENFEPIIIYLLITAILLITTLTILSLKEYMNYITRRTYIQRGNSHLTLTDIFENENRINIINQILRNPGIHHNELLRNCDLQKGQLQWHLDVLLKYNVIKKEKYGQYTIYFPITTSFDANEYLENLIVKSKTTSEILNIIKENPGINSSEISRILNLSRNTIKYHIDKLSEEKLVKLTKKGRKIELHPILN
ncbi:MAG: winged helix-turn-helix transcriptional regulator [Candidatus Thorarchaeota archaeon]